MAAELVLLSPLDGWASSLAEVPDPVFAQGMLGDGIAIDPTGSVLVAPCPGRVATLHAAHHAVTLRTDDGVDILMHIGLETVALKGDGFTAHVAEGDRVQAGQPLISFDLDILVRHARSLISPIVVTSGHPVNVRFEGRTVTQGELLMVIGARESTANPIVCLLYTSPSPRD